jgi:hypothetical protein
VFSTSNTPRGGTSVNFTPKLGTGLTYQIREDSATRLQAGLRWHHISNARVAGDADNPSRDAAMIYVGLMLPF